MMDNILEIAETIANTVMKFTTEWKAIFGTVDLDSGEGRNQIQMLPAFPTMRNAVLWLIKHEIRLMS